MVLATANSMEIDIITLSELNQKVIANRNDWIVDDKLDAAIKILHKNIIIKTQGKDLGFSCEDKRVHSIVVSC